MIIRVHRRGKDIVVAACDEDTLDKTFRRGDLRIHVSKKFYGDEAGAEEDLIAALRACTSANLVGSETVGIAIRAGFVQRDGVMQIGGVPHAQLYKISGRMS
jgi:hypothetical protein